MPTAVRSADPAAIGARLAGRAPSFLGHGAPLDCLIDCAATSNTSAVQVGNSTSESARIVRHMLVGQLVHGSASTLPGPPRQIAHHSRLKPCGHSIPSDASDQM